MSFILIAVLTAKLPLVVRTYDSVGLSARALAHAHDSAGITLAAIGIEPIWRPCHATGCISKPKPHEVEIRFVTSTRLSERGSLGFAAVDVEQHAGTLATVYVDRIDALAAQAGVDREVLLGRAVAHEIGHLILGTTDHTPSGLMRATWSSGELRHDMPLDWRFSAQQGKDMRVRLAARSSSLPAEESIVALARLSTTPADADASADAEAMWKRVRRFDAGTRVTVTVAGAKPMECYFVGVDGEDLVVLNLRAADLPKRQLLNMAIDHPDWMSATWKTVYKDNHLRVGPDGVFIKDKKVADLADIVERIPTARVASIAK